MLKTRCGSFMLNFFLGITLFLGLNWTAKSMAGNQGNKSGAPDFAKERQKQIGKIPAPPANAIVFKAKAAKALIENAKYFKIRENYPAADMTVATVNQRIYSGKPDKVGLYWKLNSLKPGKYWLGVTYDSGAGAPQGVRGALFIYLNGRIIQFDRTTDSVQVAKGVYYATALSAAAIDLKPDDEIAVLPGGKIPMRVESLILFQNKPTPGRGWMPIRLGQSIINRCSSLRLYVDAEFPFLSPKGVRWAQSGRYRVIESNSPSNLQKESDGKKAVAKCEIGNPLPIPLKVEFNAEIKSYFRKLVGSDKSTFTLPPHGSVIKEIPFEIIPDSKRYTILATAKAINPANLGWPDDTISYFPGLRQNLPFPDPFYGKDELALKFTGMLPGSRREFYLNGPWESAFSYDLNPPIPVPKNLKWRKRNVPFRRHQCALKNMKPRPRGIYVRRSFKVSELEKDNSYQLTIKTVTDEATAYVNNIKVGNVRGAGAPLVCDITKAVKPGDNELVIVVRDILAIMNPDYLDPKNPVISKAYLDAPGLHSTNGFALGPLAIKSYPSVYAHGALTVPSLRKKDISGRFEITNNSDKDKKIKVAIRVLDAGKKVLEISEKDMSIASGKTELVEFAKAWKDPILWCPKNPHLYTLSVKLSDANTGKQLDLMRVRFGFRDSWVEGNRLYFNGKPVNFKGSSTGGGKGLRVDDVQLSRGSRIPDFMDEFGYPVSQSLGCIANTSSSHNVERDQYWETGTKNILAGVKYYGNHASIIAWDLSNEWMCFLDYGGGDPKKAARRFKTVDDAVKKLDPSRWSLFNGDEDLHGLHDTFSTHYMLEATHPHPISGLGFKGHSNYFPDGAFFRDLDDDFKDGEEIIVNGHRKIIYKYGEKVLMNTENTWKTGNYMPPGPCKFAGENDVLSPAFDSGCGPIAWMWKQNLDGHRDLAVGALYNYTGVYGVARRGHMLQCFIMPDHTHHYFSGKILKRRYSLLNDIFKPADFTFKWALLAPDGKAVEKGENKQKMASGDLKRGEFSFKTPEVDKKTKFILKLDLFSGKDFVYGEERDIEVWPNNPIKISELKRKLFLFDPSGETAKVFKKAAIPFETTDLTNETWNNPKTNSLILGVDAIAKSNAIPKDKLAKFATEGGRILVLRQSKLLPGLPVKTILEAREWSSMPFVRTPQHPVFSGDSNIQYPISNNQSSNKNSKSQNSSSSLTNPAERDKSETRPAKAGSQIPNPKFLISSWDLKFWNPGHVTAKGAYFKPLSGSAVTLLDSGNQFGLEWVEMMECYRGKGLYLLNQLLVVDDYDSEPMARVVLARMIDYIGGNDSFRQPVKKLLVLEQPSEEVLERLKNLDVDFKIVKPDLKITKNDVLLVDASTLPEDFSFPEQWRKSMTEGARIIVHNATPKDQTLLAKLAGEKVTVKAQPIDIWEGRAYRNGFTDLTAGLSQLDLYWKDYEKHESGSSQAEKNKYKIEDIVYWSADAKGAKEHVYPGGLLEIPVEKGELIVDQVRWQTQNSNLDTMANRYLCALLTGLGVKVKPFVEPLQLPKYVEYETVDLTPFANRGFADEVGDDGVGGWSDQGPKFDLRQFPAKRKSFGGVPFKIGAEPKSCIVLKTNQRPHPDKVPAEVTIPIDKRVEGFYFLHSSSYTKPGRGGLYEIKYEDGSVVEIPLVSGVNMRDWASPPAGFPREKSTQSRVAWTGACEGFKAICVFSMLWVNPKPEIKVKSVRFANPDLRSCPILIALTKVLKKDVDPAKLAEMRKQAEELTQKGLKAFKAAKDTEAKSLLEKAIACDASYMPAYRSLGELCEKLKDEQATLKCYMSWIQNGAKNPLPYNRVAGILERRGDLKGALEYYSKSLEVEWNQPPTIEVKSRLMKQIKGKAK